MSQSPKLKIMVADDNEARGQLLVQVLVDSGYDVVGLAGPDTYLPTQVADAKPDLILIDTDSPSRDTLEQLTQIQTDAPRPVVMFSADGARSTIEAAVRAGVSAYQVDGLTNSRVTPVIDVAIAHFKQHQSMREELERTRTSLDERKMIDRAKGLIMKQKDCSEEQSFALLRRMAMDQKKRIGQAAKDVVQLADLFNTPPTRKEVKP